MAVSAKIYTKFFANLIGGETAGEASAIDWLSDTIKCALVADTYTPNQDSDEFWSDVSANEVSGTGYSAGGVTLANKALTVTGASNKVAIDADDPSWSAVTVTARYAVFYKSTGVAATSMLICYVDFGANQVLIGNDFRIALPSGGLLDAVVS